MVNHYKRQVFILGCLFLFQKKHDDGERKKKKKEKKKKKVIIDCLILFGNRN